jgi:hypothetical protein
MAKVRVPQSDGEITITRGGESKTYRVTDGTITVAADDLEAVLLHVEGSKPTSGSPAATTKKEG